MTDNCLASKISSCCRMFWSEVNNKQTNRGVRDSELVVDTEQGGSPPLCDLPGCSWMVESAMCSVLLIRDLSFYVPMIRDLINTWGGLRLL